MRKNPLMYKDFIIFLYLNATAKSIRQKFYIIKVWILIQSKPFAFNTFSTYLKVIKLTKLYVNKKKKFELCLVNRESINRLDIY